jgi:DNA polymerase I-like protein with 3'-5' exonuclease and polymerase domains
VLNPKTVLVDARNWESLKDSLILEISLAPLIGLDLETEDDDRHEGLNTFMKVKEGKKSRNTPLIFDIRHTSICGMSWYCKGSDTAYYINLGHADYENWVPWEEAVQLLEAKSPEAYWIAHNSPFERTMLNMSLDYQLGPNVICTMQMAVSAWNDDTYNKEDFYKRDLTGMDRLFPAIRREFAEYKVRDKLTTKQEDLLFKVIAKQSTTEHSYNGWVKKMAFGYGLKKLSQKFLGYTQMTFDEVLRGEPVEDEKGKVSYPNAKAHMGQLTGEQTVKYGADDAWVALELFPIIYIYMKENSPEAIKTFMKQENPMTQVYSDVWSKGLKVNPDSIYKAREMERNKSAEILRTMKGAIRELLPFPEEPHEKLIKYDKWFTKNWEKYRAQVVEWVESPDSEDAFEQHHQVRSPISNVWSQDLGVKESKGINVLHYMPLRTLLFDLCRFSYIQHEGKTQSNGDARDKMHERWLKKNFELDEDYDESADPAMTFLNSIQGLSNAEQSVKLYITNYLNLIDPETSRMYPVLNSMLNSRRMALSFPNVSQLPKGSDIAYVRGFFEPDDKDHILVSADWSSVELVIIGDLSGDSGFKEAFGQLPYDDLHTKAAAGGLGITIEELKARDDYKVLRTDIGKGSNFNYWYSGALGTVADKMGWTSEEMWVKVNGYRSTFPEGEAWRLSTIEECQLTGEVTLPDRHKRYRFEATKDWATEMRKKFNQYGREIGLFGELVIRKVRTRAGNQAVNSEVQGTGATLAKRSILSMEKVIKMRGYDANFKFPCHDELIYSVHKDHVLAFCRDLRKIMNHHPRIIKDLKLACTVSLGNNYWAFDLKDNPYGQIELDELQWCVPGFEKDRWEQALTEDETQKVIDYLASEHEVESEEPAF